jgi:hypothetical protein
MLRQLGDAGEVVGQERAEAVDQVVADGGPAPARRLGADVVRHAGGAWREDRQVAAAVALELQLRLHALDHLLVADAELGGALRARRPRRVGQGGELLVAKHLERLRLGV